MSIDQYRGKECLIKQTGFTGRIEDVLKRKNQHNQLAVRYLVNRPDGSQGEYDPHEIEIDMTTPVEEPLSQVVTEEESPLQEINETENERTEGTN